MNSHGLSLPLFTSAHALDDVGLRRDRVGTDHLGPAECHGLGHRLRPLHLLTHSASSCFAPAETISKASRAAATFASPIGPGNLLRIALSTDVHADLPGHRREAAQQRRVRERPLDVLEREFRRAHVAHVALGKAIDEILNAEFVEAAGGIDQDVAIGRQPAEDIDRSAAASGPG